jgi:integrase
MALTAKFVEAVKPAPSARSEYPDEIVRGLSLRITPEGVKTWSLRYRSKAGARRRLTIGGYPAISLADAREKAIQALSKLASDVDPVEERKAQVRAAKEKRVETMADLWAFFTDHMMKALRPSSASYYAWTWEKILKPRFSTLALEGVSKQHVRRALREIGAEVGTTTANRVQQLLSRLFNIAVEEGMLAANPIAGMGKLFEEKSRDRVLSEDELRRFWRALETAPDDRSVQISWHMCQVLKLCLLTCQRAGEVSAIHAREIDWKARTWTIPADRVKNGRTHVVPLSEAAMAVLDACFAVNTARANLFRTTETPDPDGYAFPSPRDPEKPITRLSLSLGMQRLREWAGLDDVSPHDLRRTGATYMASERCRVLTEVIARVLNHSFEGPKVTAIYNRYDYVAEKRAALDAWAKALAEIVGRDVAAVQAPRGF